MIRLNMSVPPGLGALLLSGLLWGPVANEAQAASPLPALETVERMDVARYLGKWYEIAKYPNRFQRQCATDTQAHYRLLDDGQLEVRNSCRLSDGGLQEAVGRARQLGGADSPRLKVRFAPAWLSFLPMVWGDYWVVALDPEYQWAAVSEPGREYLWILARRPELTPEVYQVLRERLTHQGFELEKLEQTRHRQTTSRPQ